MIINCSHVIIGRVAPTHLFNCLLESPVPENNRPALPAGQAAIGQLLSNEARVLFKF